MPKQVGTTTAVDRSGNPVELAVYEADNGGLFAIDASYIEQDAGPVCDPFTAEEFTPE